MRRGRLVEEVTRGRLVEGVTRGRLVVVVLGVVLTLGGVSRRSVGSETLKRSTIKGFILFLGQNCPKIRMLLQN